jgi:hypothetical protein
VKKYTQTERKKDRQYSQRERVIEAPLARENWEGRERESALCTRSLFVCLFVCLFLVKKKTDARVRKIFQNVEVLTKRAKVSKDKGVSLCITI